MPVRIRARHLLAIFSIVAVAVAACGGSAREATTPEPADTEASPSGAEPDAPATEGEVTDDAPVKRAACDDGSCFPCGDAYCPPGWYCDESAKGGPACGWLPECAKKPTCGCVKKIFSGGCEEKNGGLFVRD